MRYGDINGSDRSHGSFIQFTCNGEYQLIGASTARCNDGSWSETVPRCLGLYINYMQVVGYYFASSIWS